MGDDDDDGEMQRRRRRNGDGEEDDEDEDADGAVVRNPFSARPKALRCAAAKADQQDGFPSAPSAAAKSTSRLADLCVPFPSPRVLLAVAALEAADEDEADDGIGTQRMRARRAVRTAASPRPPRHATPAIRPACRAAGASIPANRSDQLKLSSRPPLPFTPQLDTAEAAALTEALQDATDKDLLKVLTKRKAEAPPPPAAAGAAGAGACSVRTQETPHLRLAWACFSFLALGRSLKSDGGRGFSAVRRPPEEAGAHPPAWDVWCGHGFCLRRCHHSHIEADQTAPEGSVGLA